jgi:hypothetical protein
VYVSQGGEVVSLVYAPRPGLPEIGDTGIGLLLQEMRGTLDRERIEKLVPEFGATVTPTPVGDGEGYWITGPRHLVRYTDSAGREQVEATRLVGNTLVWHDDGALFRIESGLGLDAVRRIGASIGD